MKELFRGAVATVATLILSCVVFCSAAEASSRAKISVTSLDAVLPYLSKDNVEVTLSAGRYRIGADDIRAGKYHASSEVVAGKKTYAILQVEGNNSVYDFTGVTLEVETAVFNAYEGRYDDFYELHILGNDNVVKGLTLIDIGSAADFPKYGCVNVIVDGARNRVEGVEVRSTGSTPYGYGELFGKGGPYTIKHWKHSACLVRGYMNHIKNCRIIHHAYGHCIFMQAADRPIIEGCYVEGEMTTTDEVLKEQGSGSKADQIDFKTVWGYRVPAGHSIAMCEGGIRAYNAGNTMIDGVRYSRGTSNVIVKDCYIKDVRAGVTLTHAKGSKSIEGCTTVGCNRGYAIGTGGKIIDCYSDAKNGPAFGVDYEHDRNIEVEITLIPYKGQHYNGTTHAAIIIGSGHKITFKKGKGLKCDQELYIHIGGDNKTIGMLADDNNYVAKNIEIINETKYPIILDDNSSNNTVSSRGRVTDHGTDNTIKK